MADEKTEYAGFWLRTGACIVDSILLLLVTTPLLLGIYGMDHYDTASLFMEVVDVFIRWLLPAFLTIYLWHRFRATPGKMALKLKVLDANSGNAASIPQCIVRYLGYFVSLIPFGLGVFWVAFDRRKQGWHDKLAGTVVVRDNHREPVTFHENS